MSSLLLNILTYQNNNIKYDVFFVTCVGAGNEPSRAPLGSARFGSASERAELGSARYFCEPENQARLGSVEAREPARAGSRATLNNVN